MKKLAALFLLPFGAFALTPIADTVYTASGTTAAPGSYLVIKWPRFTSGGSHPIPPNVQTVPLANGTFSIALESTATAQFPFHYTVEYHLVSAGQQLPPYTETWDVPDTATPQRIANVLVVAPAPLPAPAAKGDLAASDGVSTVWLPAPAAAGYVLQTDPTQPTGLAYASISSLGSNFDPAGAAATGQFNAKTYTDSAIAGLSNVYDQAGAAAAVQAAFQTSIANTISALNLGSASTHSASDFDAAGAASAAQAAAKTYTDSAVASGVTSSYVNNAITNAITGLNLLSASQHAASDFDPAGTATAAVSSIPIASAAVNGLLSKADWATFNGKQNAIPANTYDTYGAAAIAQANAISSAQTNANAAIAALNLKSASQHLATDFDTAGAATTAVNAIPTATASVKGLLSMADWATFNNKQAALGFTPLNAANNLSDVTSVSQARTNLGLGSAATQATSAFDPAGAATAAAPVFKGPYVVQGSNTFIAASGKQTASTLPSGLSLSVLTGSTAISSAMVTTGANGNLLLGDPNSTGPFYYGASATSSIEMEFTTNGTAVSGGQVGLYVWDSAHNLLYLWIFFPNGGTQNSIETGSYAGSSAPTGIAGTRSFTSTPQAVLALKIQVINGQFHYFFSVDGGNNFTDFFTTAQTSVNLANAGIYFAKAYVNVLNLVIQ